MDIEAAVKQVRAEKQKDNYLLVSFGWNEEYLLPFKEGMELVSALGKAFQLKDPHGNSQIVPIGKDKISIQILAAQEVEDIKVAMLLGITLSELKSSRQPSNKE